MSNLEMFVRALDSIRNHLTEHPVDLKIASVTADAFDGGLIDVHLARCELAELASGLLAWADTLTTALPVRVAQPPHQRTAPADHRPTSRLHLDRHLRHRHQRRHRHRCRLPTRRTTTHLPGRPALLGGDAMTTQTRAERMRQPLAIDVVTATAEKHGVCVRPFTMEVGDLDTGELRHVAVPCGSTVESVCGPCARKARALRITQCREGWHLVDEPDFTSDPPSEDHKALLELRADLVAAYRQADGADLDELRDEIRSVDEELRALGMRGRLPSPELVDRPATPKRSTKRRQDAPDLPRRRVEKRTLGREFAGRFRPSMFVTLTCDSYGPVRDDGTPRDPSSYDYRRAARDAVHFASLVDRWWQNLRRCVGWDVQYFATVEPQKRVAPHLHAAIRGSIPHEVLREVTAATYHQVWWPAHDELRLRRRPPAGVGWRPVRRPRHPGAVDVVG